MSEEIKNPLDQMNDDAQSENGDASHSDAAIGGGDADQQNDAGDGLDSSEDESLDGELTPDPVVPAAPTAAVPSQPVAQPPAPPQFTGARVAVATSDRDAGIEYGKGQQQMREHLAKQPKVAFMIPRDPLEAPGLAYETVQLNGLRMTIKKGVMVTIPRQVAEVLAEKFRVQLEAGSDKLIGRNEDVMDKLS